MEYLLNPAFWFVRRERAPTDAEVRGILRTLDYSNQDSYRTDKNLDTEKVKRDLKHNACI